eukprot:12030371-Alexandrium_andersonii.AAC.1
MATSALPGAPTGWFSTAARAGRGGGIDDAGNGGHIRRVARRLPLCVAPVADLKSRRSKCKETCLCLRLRTH